MIKKWQRFFNNSTIQRCFNAIIVLIVLNIIVCTLPMVSASFSAWFSALNAHFAAGMDWQSGVVVRNALGRLLWNAVSVICLSVVAYNYGKKVCCK